MLNNVYTLAFFSTMLMACTEWDINITTSTGTSNNTAVSTVVTASAGDSEDPTTSDVLMTTTGTPDISGSETTVAVDETTGDPVTTTGEESSTTAPMMGESFPPIGCAFIVEVMGRTKSAQRHVTIDRSNCTSRDVDLVFFAFGGPPATDLELTTTAPCTTYGGAISVAAMDPLGEVIEIAGPDDPPAYMITIMVDGVVSDTASVPQHLEGLTWPEHPTAPIGPLRRNADWSWTVADQHVSGCSL